MWRTALSIKGGIRLSFITGLRILSGGLVNQSIASEGAFGEVPRGAKPTLVNQSIASEGAFREVPRGSKPFSSEYEQY